MRAIIPATAAILALAGAVPASGQELIQERLFLVPTQLNLGVGTVRLDGMGGFEAAVPDENYEIDLYDFSHNPAGFGDDRDSWSIDTRYSHKELSERDLRTPGDDVKINEGTILIGYHAPGNMGIGGRVDYAEVGAMNFTGERNDFTISGLRLQGNRYLTPRFSLGVNLSRSSEDENNFSREIYNISHTGAVTRAGLGAAYRVVEGVTVGARGEVFHTQLDGESRGPFHTDTFDWSRPGGVFALQGFVNRGRLHAGADYTHEKLDGEESVRVSWSTRFHYNPTDDVVKLRQDTFTENRTRNQFQARGRLDVVPGRLNAGAAYIHGSQDFTVIVNPNAIGSLERQQVEAKSDAAVGGVSWTGVGSRLLLAAEVKLATTKVTNLAGDEDLVNKLDQTVLRGGAEYLLGEMLIARAGMIRSRDKYAYDQAPDLSGAYNTTTLATGLGVVPAGGIWQFDVAYDVDVQNDLDVDRSRFSAYVRYLF